MDTREKYDELCRLCASYDAVKMNIFGQDGKNRQLVDKIQTCLPFKIDEDDRLPKCLCYRCMYNLENFYDFRTACVNAVALLERSLPSNDSKNGGRNGIDMEKCSELRTELLKEKEKMPILIPEAPVVNPNAALGTPPRLNSDGEAIHDLEMGQSSTDDCQYYLDDNHHNNKSDEYEMDIELNPSDFLDMITDMESSNQIDQISSHDVFKHTSEQHEVYVCSLCDKAFSSKGHLSLHAKIHVGAENDVVGEKVITDDHTSYKRPYQCDLCNKSYSTAKHRWGHVSTTHRGHPAVTCRFCSRIYSTRINLEEHIKSRHTGLSAPPEPPGPYIQQDTRFQCKKCPKMYTNITDLNKHSRVCIVGNERTKNKNKNNNIKLPIKGKCLMDASDDMSSNESDDYNREYRNAEAKLSKNPQLTILKQALTRNNNNNNNEGINKRLKIKDKKKLIIKKEMIDSVDGGGGGGGGGYSKEYEKIQEKPYICTLCKKDFVVKSSLSRHILSSHGIDPSPFIENDKCLKKLLLIPTATNNNIKSEPLEIDSINQGDENDDNDDDEEQQQQQQQQHDETINDNHIEIETVFVCEICTRDFNDRASLWLHIRATHKEYAAFACGICLKICSDNEQLLNHVNMYHGGSKLLVSEQRRYSCTICGRQHDSRKKLITHVSIHNIDSSYDPANFVQLNSNYYSDNIPIINDGQEQWTDFDAEDGEKVNCHVCFKSFPNEDHLIRHQRNAHKTDQLINDTTTTLSTTPSSSSTTTTNGTKGPYNLFYVCELCGSSHPSKWERWLHVSNTHYDDTTIKCERTDCAKIFSTKSLKNDHVQHHAMQGPSPNTCEICGKLWGSRVDYWKHVMGVHADTVPLICGVCLKVFSDVYQLSLHVKKNHWPLTNGDFSCDICGRPYSNKSKMSRHRKIHGIVDNDLMMMTTTNGMSLLNQINNDDDNNININDNIQDYNLTCEICTDKSFINWDDLCNHRRLTHGLFPCDLCNKCYGRASHLWKHVNRVHKGHSDVTCRYCLKTSASKDHLAAHIAKTHRYEPDEKQQLINNYINNKTSGGSGVVGGGVGGGDDDVIHHCEKCNKGFHKRYLLRRHMKGCQNYRKDPGALLTRCRACERIFKDRASLQKHIENHHSSYTCHLCNETITSKLGIMTHNRINHMNHDDLTCTSCKKLFRTKEDLDVHKKDHKYHNSLNVCDFCGDTVESKLKLKMHILSLHRNEIGVSCGVCLIPMKDPKDLKKHVEDEHPGILSRPNTCQVCGKQYASKWKAFDHTKKCHGKVFRTCKQCLAVFTSDDDIRYHYEYIHNVTKEQLANIENSYDASSKIDDQSIDIDYMDYYDDDDNNSLLYNNSFSTKKRKRSESHECDICYELFANDDEFSQHYRDVHNKDPNKMFKKIKSKKKSKNRDNYECKSCTKQFSTRSLYWNHIKICTNKYLKDDLESGNSMSILESHLKNNNQLKIQQQQYDNNNDDFTDAAAGAAAAVDDDNNDVVNDMSLNIPDFNLFEDINMQLSGQKPLPPLMPLTTVKNPQPTKCYRKDSRKVYDESTNTVCACEVCGKQWPAKKHLWQHLIRFHRAEAAVTCGVCLKLCKTYFDLSCHLKEAHEAILSCEGNNFTCKTCGRYHNARSKLLLHMSIHINNNEHIWCMKCAVSFENQDKLNEHANNCIVKRREEADVGDQIIEENNIKHENEEQEEEEEQTKEKEEEEHEEQQEQEQEEEEGEYDDKGSLIGDGASLMEEVGEEADFESEHEASEDNGENNTEQSEHSQHSEDSDSSSSSSSSNSSVAASASEDEGEEAEANAKDSTKCSDVIIKEHESHDDKSNISIDIKPVINNDSSTSQENKNDEKLLNTVVDVIEPINIKCEKNSINEERPLISSESSPKPDDNNDKIKQGKDEEENENEEEEEEEEADAEEEEEEEEVATDLEHDETVKQDEQNEEANEDGDDDDDQVEEEDEAEEEEEEQEQEDEEEEEEEIYPEANHEGLEGIKDIDYEQSSPDKSHDEIESDNEDNEEEGVFVTEHEDEMQVENLDGTVLMVANDADGNQILIQRNVDEIEADDNELNDVTGYIYQQDNVDYDDNYADNNDSQDVDENNDNEMEIQSEADDNVNCGEESEDDDDDDDDNSSAKNSVSRT